MYGLKIPKDIKTFVSVKGADGKKTSYTYDLLGQRISTNGAWENTEYTYDDVGNLVSQITNGKYDVSLNYTYDLSGRMISESRTENGAATESSYIYDAIGQLTEFTRGDYSESYTYDPAGNMLSKTAGGVKTNYTYNAANQLVGDGTYRYTYDKIGNLVEKAGNGGLVSYTYNALNLLETWTDGENTESYTYNAAGLLSTVNTNTSTTSLTWDILYGDGVVISEKTNDTVTDYTYGLERISASTGKARTEYVYDGRGSVIGEVTKAGLLSTAKVTTKAYTPFGEQIGEATSGFGWNGEYFNATTGQVYLRARFYEPEMNRFSQKDILRGSVIDTTSQNRYTYCTSDPVNFVDPSGMLFEKAKAWVNDTLNTAKTVFNDAAKVAKDMYYGLTGKPDPRQAIDAVTSAAPSASNAASALVKSAVQAAAGAVAGAVSGIANSIIGGQGSKSTPNPNNPEVELQTRFFACDNSKDAETVYIMFSNNPQYDNPDPKVNSDYTDAMYYQLHKALSEGKNVVITAVNSKKEFAAAWNNLPEDSVIPEVYMIFHSNGRSLIFEEESPTNGYSVDGDNTKGQPVLGNITDLPARDINTLYLLGCNTGNVAQLSNPDGRENLAIVFSRMIDGTVIGVDGELAYGAPSTLVDDQYNVFFPRMSQEQALFSNPQGYVEYKNGGYEVIGGLDTPMEAFWEWALMHGNDDIDEWRNN